MPVKNPVIPHKIIKLVSDIDKCNQPATVAPTLAPALSDGAKMPPAAPIEKEIMVPIILKNGISQERYF